MHLNLYFLFDLQSYWNLNLSKVFVNEQEVLSLSEALNMDKFDFVSQYTGILSISIDQNV